MVKPILCAKQPPRQEWSKCAFIGFIVIARLGTFVVTPDSSAFVPVAGSRYSVSLEFGPSKEVRYASIGTNDGIILDAFTCTNGIKGVKNNAVICSDACISDFLRRAKLQT